MYPKFPDMKIYGIGPDRCEIIPMGIIELETIGRPAAG